MKFRQSHPPVTVTDPLTETAAQNLGLSLGDGLAVSTGNLVAALGNGLGIDANGNVYIPAGAVGPTEASLGDGIAGDGAGNIAAALGGNLGIDANGSVYIPSNAVSQTELSFDPATQTELNNHAGSSGAHHARPTFAVETGTFTANYADSPISVSFANTYKSDTVIVSSGPISYEGNAPHGCGRDGWNTDANGNVTGAVISVSSYYVSTTHRWTVMGETI